MRKIFICFFTIVLFSALTAPVSAQVSKFQALYLLNFSKNLEWNQENVTIGVVGNTQTLLELEPLISKYPNITLKKISGSESIGGCQLIFLPSAQSRNFNLIQQKIGKSSIVLVAEDKDLIHQGAEMAFYMEGNKLRFSINQPALEACGVKASDKLLSVANLVD